MLGHPLDQKKSGKNTNKGPENGHQVARVARLRLAMAQEPRHRVGQVRPRRRRDERVEVPVNVEGPCSMGESYHGGGRVG